MQILCEFDSGGVLVDDMGLGKILQLLVYVFLEKQVGWFDMLVLVVMFISLIFNWLDEVECFVFDLCVLVLYGVGWCCDFVCIDEYDLVLIIYVLLLCDVVELGKWWFYLLIFDEVQNIKNVIIKVVVVVCELVVWYCLCLIGMLLENYFGEFWLLFYFLMFGWFGDVCQFVQDYCMLIEKYGDEVCFSYLVVCLWLFLL